MVAVMTTSLITISPLPGTERAARGVGHRFPGPRLATRGLRSTRLRPRDWPIEDYWPGWAIAFLCFGGGSLMSVLPGLLLIFWLRWVWIGLAAFLLYGLVVSAAIVIGIETAHPGSFSTDDAFGFTTFLFSIGMFLGIGLALIRACGFILQIGRSQNW